MKIRGIFRWVKDHVRPYIKTVENKDLEGNIRLDNNIHDIEDVKGKAEVGINIKWRF